MFPELSTDLSHFHPEISISSALRYKLSTDFNSYRYRCLFKTGYLHFRE